MVISKKLQSKFMCIETTLAKQLGIIKFFEKYRNELELVSSMNIAKNIACYMSIYPTFLIRRCIIKEKKFNANDLEMQWSCLHLIIF